MAKVSIGLRGWRFEEADLFTEDGEWKPLDEIPEEPRHRLVRLQMLVTNPCHCCYLIHGEEDIERCREADIVYGEPLDEVLLCEPHEAEFLYWYREAGGSELAGTDGFRDAFHEWFDDGNRAPEDYGGLDHVETDPTALPDLPDQEEVQRRLEAEHEGEELVPRGDVESFGPDEKREDEPAESDPDLDIDYPRR